MRWRWSVFGFVACCLAVLGGLAWVTFHTLRLERLEHAARREARLQESIRLVLWRMDSTLTPIIAREAARPYFEYQSFYPADTMFADGAADSRTVLVPSSLMRTPDPFVHMYFQEDGGTLTSPQTPSGEDLALAGDAYITTYSVAAAEQRMARLRTLLHGTAGSTKGPIGGSTRADPDRNDLPPVEANLRDKGAGEPLQSAQMPEGQQVWQSDYQARQAVTDLARNIGETKYRNIVPQITGAEPRGEQGARERANEKGEGAFKQAAAKKRTGGHASESHLIPLKESSAAGSTSTDEKSPEEGAPSHEARDQAMPVASPAAGRVLSIPVPERDEDETIGPSVTQGSFVAKWIDIPDSEPELIFVREVNVGERTIRQGFWLDWPALRVMLVESARDILPGTSLRPMVIPLGSDDAGLARALAAIPAQLIVPPIGEAPSAGWSAARTVIAVTWVLVLMALIVTGLVLRTSIELAERRGRFVSAVTHELRTPLTTFCLYSQMLADGMIKDTEAQKGYFNTLRNESLRLARIVESVLDYARLSGKRTVRAPVTTTVPELLETQVRSLRARCDLSGMTLVVEGDADDPRPLTTDTAMVERIISNLVDNACKYGAEAEDRRVHLRVNAAEQDITITVQDHGAGIDAGDAARLFRPFVRGERHGHGAIPGLGLGLALARGLARELGGNLEYLPGGGGAAFRLTIPRDAA